MELATSALTSNKNPSKVLTNQLSSVEDSSLAYIATFKTVAAKINQIKTKFCLNDNGTDWREAVTGIGKKKKKKVERETNKTRNKERKEAQKKSRELVKKRDEWLVDNIGESGDEESTGSEGEEIENPAGFNVERKKKPADGAGEKPKKVAKKKPLADPTKTADPFFLTGSGETYYATKVIDRIQPNGPNDGLDRKERRAQQFNGSAKRSNGPVGPSAFKKQKIVAASTAKIIPEGIHPSWAAKMKSKSIDEFKGKKMKFDDDSIAPQPSARTNELKGGDEKIHPSWAAKQKLKPVISEFKGSKIVFDD